MRCFELEIKKLYKNSTTKVLIFLLLFVMISDPISVRLQDLYFDGQLLCNAGKNPFQYWLLINSVSWGNILYNTLFFIFPVLISGLVLFKEKSTSMLTLQIIRCGRNSYYLNKILATFVFTFVCFFLLLSINILITYIVFPSTTEYSDYYTCLIPVQGTFAYEIFNRSSILLIFIYTLLNAGTIAIFAIFVLGIHMTFNFQNRYVALITPVIVLFIITFILDSIPSLFHYNIRLIIQPRAANAISEILTNKDIILTLAIWVFISILLIIIGLFRNKDVL